MNSRAATEQQARSSGPLTRAREAAWIADARLALAWLPGARRVAYEPSRCGGPLTLAAMIDTQALTAPVRAAIGRSPDDFGDLWSEWLPARKARGTFVVGLQVLAKRDGTIRVCVGGKISQKVRVASTQLPASVGWAVDCIARRLRGTDDAEPVYPYETVEAVHFGACFNTWTVRAGSEYEARLIRRYCDAC